MKITVKIKTSGIDGLEKVLNKIKEIEKVTPHMSVDIEVDCRKKSYSRFVISIDLTFSHETMYSNKK